MKDVSWIKDLIFMSYKYWLGILLAAVSFTILGLSDFAEDIGIRPLYESINTWVSLSIIISIAFLVAAAISSIERYIKGNRNSKRLMKGAKERLKNLNSREKEILKMYFEEDSRTCTFSYNDGHVRELEMLHILYRSSQISNAGTYFPYNIQPWAWDYLEKKQHLLE